MSQNTNRPRKLKDLLESGQVRFSNPQQVEQNLPEISNWMEARLTREPLPPRRFGRPPKGEEREATEIISFRLPKSLVVNLDLTATGFGLSRNRFVQIAIMKMIKEPECEMDFAFDNLQGVSKVAINDSKTLTTLAIKADISARNDNREKRTGGVLGLVEVEDELMECIA